MKSLTIIIGSRGRPDELLSSLRVSLQNIRSPHTKFLVALDEDDETHDIAAGSIPNSPHVIVSVRPREDTRGEKCDRALIEAPAHLYLVGHDCNSFATPGFDEIFLAKARLFPDGIGVVRSPFVGGGSFPPSYQAMTAKWVEKIGYVYSHDYPFWFVDHEVHDIARLVGRYFRVDVQASAHRPRKTIRMHDVAFWASFYDLMALERRAKARQLINSPDFLTPEWQKADLRVNFDAVEAEGRAINERVRATAESLEKQRGEQEPPDEGYLRAKAKAEQKLAGYLDALKKAA
jgi:hypothetical protein